LESNRPVRELVASIPEHWDGSWHDQCDPASPHEASLLHLQIDKAHHRLGRRPRWHFATTVGRTVRWYRQVQEGQTSALAPCLVDQEAFEQVKCR
jgi:CDP-glucose 4,6-dehydratase